MNLFKYEGYKVNISPEAMMLKPFKEIYDRDKSKSKDKAFLELAYIYFYCDPRSDYQYIIDPIDKDKAIREGLDLLKWKPDKKITEAIEFYNSFKSTSSLERFIDGKCATLSTPYLCFIADAISIVVLQFSLPPAPYVTLIKSGFKSFSSSSVE